MMELFLSESFFNSTSLKQIKIVGSDDAVHDVLCTNVRCIPALLLFMCQLM